MKAALTSQAVEVVVVLGHMADQVKPAIEQAIGAEKRLRFVTNPDFAEGLSTSVRTGIAALGKEIDAAIVQLGDMPGVNAALLDRLMAAFSPVEGRSICVPTVGGKRGNPVLWDRRFFAEMAKVVGRHRRQAPDRRARRPRLRSRDDRRGRDHRHRHARGARRLAGAEELR